MRRCTVGLCVVGLFLSSAIVMAGAAPPQGPQKSAPTEPGPLSYEGEVLAVDGATATSGTVAIQQMAQFGNQWSNNAQGFWNPTKLFASVSTKILIGMTKDALYVFQIAYTKAPDYGMVQLYVNNKPVGAPFDGYAEKVTYGGLVTLGTAVLLKGPAWNDIRWTVVGKNPKSTNFYVGIDLMKFTPFKIVPFTPKSGALNTLKSLPPPK